MHVGVCRLTLLAGHARSLKDKRQIVRKLKDRVRAKYHVQLSEVGGLDTWQRVVLGFAVVSGERSRAEALIAEIAGFVRAAGERTGEVEIASDEREVVSYPDEPFGDLVAPQAEADDDSWIPAAWKDDG